jgi:hypothetical protein
MYSKREITMNILFAILLCVLIGSSGGGCGGFASDDPEYINEGDIILDAPTKYIYEKIFIGPCSFPVSVKVKELPLHWKHFEEVMHKLSVKWKRFERSEFSEYDKLKVHLPCGICKVGDNTNIAGKISVVDSMGDVELWGCGNINPSLNVESVTSKYGGHSYSYTPSILSAEDTCNDEPVLIDIRPACNVFWELYEIRKESGTL